MSFDFYAGSMGGVVGEKLVRAIEKAKEKKVSTYYFFNIWRSSNGGGDFKPNANG